MANTQSQVYWSDSVQRYQPYVLQLGYQITAAKTVTQMEKTSSLSTFDAFASQAVIDGYLGTTNEFLLNQFDATSMGVDAFGGLVNMSGQAATLLAAEAVVYSGASGQTVVPAAGIAVAAFPLSASTLAPGAAVGANGNIGFRFVLTGLDALTSGLILVRLSLRVK